MCEGVIGRCRNARARSRDADQNSKVMENFLPYRRGIFHAFPPSSLRPHSWALMYRENGAWSKSSEADQDSRGPLEERHKEKGVK